LYGRIILKNHEYRKKVVKNPAYRAGFFTFKASKARFKKLFLVFDSALEMD